jgi:hypothetical protein
MNDYKNLKNAYSDNTRSIIKENFYPSSGSGCPAGKYCPISLEDKPCPEGYYCPSSILLPQVCTSGFYCPRNSKAPIACPYNRPISARLSKSIDDCINET